MGIPSLFSWCVRNYPNIITKCIQYDCDYLYLDFNCTIYTAIRVIDDTVLKSTKSSDIIKKVILYLDYIINTISPKKLIYIGIDGVVPRSKMITQRYRRYRYMKEKLANTKMMKFDEDTIKHDILEENLDMNMISPSTEFMYNLGQEIRKYLTEKKKTLTKVQMVFSDCSIAGEGEHKLKTHIIKERNPADNIMIYGLDADLLMLGLLLNYENISLLREAYVLNDTKEVKCAFDKINIEYLTISIPCLKESILKLFSPANPISLSSQIPTSFLAHISKSNSNSNLAQTDLSPPTNLLGLFNKLNQKNRDYNIIVDFVFISFLLGNDFIPHTPCLTVRENGIEILALVYKYCVWKDWQTQTQTSLPFLINVQSAQNILQVSGDKDFNINVQVMTDIMKTLAIMEDDLGKSLTQSRENRIKRWYANSNNRLGRPTQSGGDGDKPVKAEEKVEIIEHKIPDPILIGYDGWIMRYYYYNCNIFRKEEHEIIEKMCNSYFKTLKWIFFYYTDCTPFDWTFTYEYDITPTLTDLSRYLCEIPAQKLHKLWTEPFIATINEISPCMQLVYIIPKESSDLLPKCYSKLVHGELSLYFPKEYQMNMYNKRFLWETIPILPYIDDEYMTNLLKEKKCEFTEQEKLRDTQQSMFIL